MSNTYTKFNSAQFIRDLVGKLEGDASLTTAQIVAAFGAAKSGVDEKQIKQALNSLVNNRGIGKTLDGNGFVSAENGFSAAERKGYKAANKPAVAPRAKKPRAAKGTAAAVKYSNADFVEYLTERLGQPSTWNTGDPLGYPGVLYAGHDLTPEGFLARGTKVLGHEPTGWYFVDNGDKPSRIGLL